MSKSKKRKGTLSPHEDITCTHLLAKGLINFKDKANNCSIASRPFIYVDENIDLESLNKIVKDDWKEFKSVNLIISVINSIGNDKPFKTSKIIETLRDGIKNIVNGSKVWFIGNGIDLGLPKIIGRVVQETIASRDEDIIREKKGSLSKNWNALTFLGIVSDQSIKEIENSRRNNQICQTIEINIDKCDKYSLNSDHTHFLIVREKVSKRVLSTDTKTNCSSMGEYDDLANSSTNRFRNRFEKFLRETKTGSSSSSLRTDLKRKNENSFNEILFPMVYIFIRGTLDTIEILYQKIEEELPIVIIKGSGSTADLIVQAHETINIKPNKIYDQNKLKKELNRSLIEEYPILTNQIIQTEQIHDRIIFIAKENEAKKLKLLNFIDLNSSILSANEIHKTILSAYLKSQKGKNVSIQNALLKLTIDWGLIDIVQSDLFDREDFLGYTIPNNLFEEVLIDENLELFLDLFLERDFSLHHYLNTNPLRHFFNRQTDRDFFTITSLEGILGWTGDDNQLPSCFIEHSLIKIIQNLTSMNIDFLKQFQFNSLEPHFTKISSKTNYHRQIHAETMAIRCLVICAVLTNRHNLAKILWKRTSEPIPLALICSMMCYKLSSYCRESYQKSLLKKQSKEYTTYAIGVLDKSFKENEIQTFQMLSFKHSDLNDMTVVKLSYNWNNQEFLSHPILQKWVTRRFYGEITPKELSWGFFTCPEPFKIIFSAFFIFPMSFWISFSPIGQEQITFEENDQNQSDQEQSQDQRILLTKENDCQSCQNQQKILKEKENFLKRIDLFWNSPITKFYTDFVSYLFFLILFTLSVMWPSCGNLFLDSIVWFWATSITIENIRILSIKYRFEKDIPLKGVLFGITFQLTFLLLYFSIRILHFWSFETTDIIISKAILAVGLIYYYYRVLFIYFPISSKFGPMMIRLQYMICDDFVTFMQLFVIFMISSGVAITSVLYPYHPLNWELFSKAILFRGLMALFLSDLSDLKNSSGNCRINATTKEERRSVCSSLSSLSSSESLSISERYGISTLYCRQTSWIAWILLIQYFFLAKRLLISLLTALFSVTGSRIQQQSEQIWCYNQYAILVEYQKRSRLPPPFSIISSFIDLILFLWNQWKSLSCFQRSSKRREKTNPSKDTTMIMEPLIVRLDQHSFNTITTEVDTTKKLEEKNDPCIYWKCKAKEYYLRNQSNETSTDQSKSLINVQKEIDTLRKSMIQSKNQIFNLEETINHSDILLEKILPRISLEDSKKFYHIYSCQSPYIYTNDRRYLLTDKSLLWTIRDELYRPTLITFSKEHKCYSDNDRSFVESHWSSTIVSSTNRNTSDLSLSPIQLNNQSSIPLNPMGRTGVVGRGAHIRWGGNKSLIIILTRLKKIDNELVLLQGKSLLETIVFIDQNTQTCKFPQVTILDEQSPYSALCRLFNDCIFENTKCQWNSSFEKREMIEFFESLTPSNELESHIISRGYIDDVRNTDNAWLEADIWNFHYNSMISFPPLRNDGTVIWESLTDHLRRLSIQTSIFRKIARIHDAYFD